MEVAVDQIRWPGTAIGGDRGSGCGGRGEPRAGPPRASAVPACTARRRCLRGVVAARPCAPACSHGSIRAKHGRSRYRSSPRFRSASSALILAGPAASDCVLVTQACLRRGSAHTRKSRNKITSAKRGLRQAQSTKPRSTDRFRWVVCGLIRPRGVFRGL